MYTTDMNNDDTNHTVLIMSHSITAYKQCRHPSGGKSLYTIMTFSDDEG